MQALDLGNGMTPFSSISSHHIVALTSEHPLPLSSTCLDHNASCCQYAYRQPSCPTNDRRPCLLCSPELSPYSSEQSKTASRAQRRRQTRSLRDDQVCSQNQDFDLQAHINKGLEVPMARAHHVQTASRICLTSPPPDIAAPTIHRFLSRPNCKISDIDGIESKHKPRIAAMYLAVCYRECSAAHRWHLLPAGCRAIERSTLLPLYTADIINAAAGLSNSRIGGSSCIQGSIWPMGSRG